MRIHHAMLSMTLASTVALLATASDALNAHDHGILKLASRELVAGDSVPLAGEKFARRGTITLLLTGIRGKIRLQQIRADEKGAFAVSLHVPGELSPGAYRLVAVAPDGDEVASLDVAVVSARPAVPAVSHHESEMPSAVGLALPRARSPWVTGAAALAIALSLISGAWLLRRPSAGHGIRHEPTDTRSP